MRVPHFKDMRLCEEPHIFIYPLAYVKVFAFFSYQAGQGGARQATASSRGTAAPSGGQSGRQEGGQSGIFKFENLKIKAADFPCFQIYM